MNRFPFQAHRSTFCLECGWFEVASDDALCQLVAHPDTPPSAIRTRQYGHAQFECLITVLEAKAYEKLIDYAWCAHCW